MQKPIRYYIVKAEDQPVVRSVPVVRAPAPVSESSAATRPAERRDGRTPAVARLMRAAIHRHDGDR